MKKLIGLIVVAGLTLALLVSPAASGSPGVEEEVLSLLPIYEQAFETGDAEAMAGLYWHDERLTAFWPDAETAFRIDGWTQMENQLKGITGFISQLPPGALNLEIRQPSITVVGDVAIATAYWLMTMLTPEGSEVIQGRISEVWKKIDGKWVIIHEHLSLFPTP